MESEFSLKQSRFTLFFAELDVLFLQTLQYSFFVKGLLVFLLIVCATYCWAGNPFRVVFYNVENLFDCSHDSLKNDVEFLPGGLRGWTPTRYYDKIGKIGKVLAGIGETRFPDLVGLAEVENDACLFTLTRNSPLKQAGYQFVHKESADSRGVDVALLYNRYRFCPEVVKTLTPVFKNEPERTTRDVLYVNGRIDNLERLHVFVCHFPSRLGGDAVSETYRQQVARMIRSVVDSLFLNDDGANVLIMGDFNDYPFDASLSVDLKVMSPVRLRDDGKPAESDTSKREIIGQNSLLDLMLKPGVQSVSGTHKNEGEWGYLDQFIVSGSLYKHSNPMRVFCPEYLLVPDTRFLGVKPFRTYDGYRWQGGFSDHLPIWVDFLF